MDNKFKYYLRYHDGVNWNYYIVSSGSVTTTTTKTEISNLPEGWGEATLNWERGFNYWGIMRSYTTPLRFVKDGAKILRHIFVNQGINGKCQLFIEKLNTSIASYGYDSFYEGDIDFSRFKTIEHYVIVEIMEKGFPSYVKSREGTPYEIDIADDVNKVWVRLPEDKLQFNQKWLCANGVSIDKDFFGNHIPTLTSLQPEGVNLQLELNDQFFTVGVVSPVLFVTNNSGGSVTFNLDFIWDIEGELDSGVADSRFEIGYQIHEADTNNMVSHQTIYNSGFYQGDGTAYNYTGTHTETITLSTNRGIYIEFRYRKADTNLLLLGGSLTSHGTSVELSYDTTTPETYFPCLKSGYLFEKIIDKVTDGTVTAASDLLTAHEDKLFVCGDAVRNLDKSKIKPNLRDFHKDTFGFLGGTALIYDRVNNEAKIESLSEVFQAGTLLDIGEVSNLSFEPITELAFSNLVVGYDNQTYDNVNGKDEFNIEQRYVSELLVTSQEQNYKCASRTDKYGLLLLAINLTGKKTTDADTDNDIFIIHADLSSVAGTIPSGYAGAGEDYYDLYKDPSLTISNIYNPDGAFNIFFSPARCVFRLGSLIRSILYGMDSTDLKYTYSSKSNYNATRMETNDGVTIINEGDDIAVGDLDNPYFYPFVFTMDTVSNSTTSEEMDTNEYKRILFTHKEKPYKGFVMKNSMNANLPEKQTFRVICTTDTDITQLIT